MALDYNAVLQIYTRADRRVGWWNVCRPKVKIAKTNRYRFNFRQQTGDA
jgi:hypothetical protein